jgi:hypothetical protein
MFLIRTPVLAGLVIVFACSTACSVLTVAAYHVFFSQKTVVMDIAGFVASQKEGYTAGKISAGELVHNIDSLICRIGSVEKNRVLVIDQPAAGLAKEGPTISVDDPAAEVDEDRER